MTGFVYAMATEDGRAKIGWSADPVRRLSKVNSDTATPARLAGAIPATKEQEAEILELLSPWRIHRSWHRNEGAVAVFISKLPSLAPREVTCEPIAALLKVACVYRTVAGLSRSTISWRMFGDTKKLAALGAGADIRFSRFKRALQWLSDTWPKAAIWPTEIDRPAPSAEQEAA